MSGFFEIIRQYLYSGDMKEMHEVHRENMFAFRSVFEPSDETTQTETFPEGRSGHRIFVDEHYLYLVGGYTNARGHDGHIFQEVWRFNLLTRSWKLLKLVGFDGQTSSIPNALASFSLSLANLSSNFPIAIVFGGTALPFGPARSSDVFALRVDNTTDTVISCPIKPAGKIRRIYGHAMVRSASTNEDELSFYVAGGTSGMIFYLNVDELRFSNTTGEWNWVRQGTIENVERGMYRLEVVNFNEKIYMFGGGTPSMVKDFEDIIVFDLVEKTYDNLKTFADAEHGFPTARRCHSLTQWYDRVYLVGGCGIDSIDEQGQRVVDIYGDVWSMNLNTLQWTKLPHGLKKPVFFHDAAVTKSGRLVVCGGVCDEYSRERTSAVQEMWLIPPPLRFSAASAMLPYSRPSYASTNEREVTNADPVAFVEAILTDYESTC